MCCWWFVGGVAVVEVAVGTVVGLVGVGVQFVVIAVAAVVVAVVMAVAVLRLCFPRYNLTLISTLNICDDYFLRRKEDCRVGLSALTRSCRLWLDTASRHLFLVVRIVHVPKLVSPVPEHVKAQAHAQSRAQSQS